MCFCCTMRQTKCSFRPHFCLCVHFIQVQRYDSWIFMRVIMVLCLSFYLDQDQVFQIDTFRRWWQLICVPRTLFPLLFALLFFSFAIQSVVLWCFYLIFCFIFSSLSSLLYEFFSWYAFDITHTRYVDTYKPTHRIDSVWTVFCHRSNACRFFFVIMHSFWLSSPLLIITQQCHLTESDIRTRACTLARNHNGLLRSFVVCRYLSIAYHSRQAISLSIKSCYISSQSIINSASDEENKGKQLQVHWSSALYWFVMTEEETAIATNIHAQFQSIISIF